MTDSSAHCIWEDRNRKALDGANFLSMSAIWFLKKEYGQDFASKGARKYFKKVKNAQEAHEAIRPTNIQILPCKSKTFQAG
ncbi:unnamed protein product [Dovyalis caffra]|uniref:Uncharacterized protein n=1 Tax=Dovyalis caffra TaxID=77055 RepID=A0AAV1SM67_9ROSI|nr:unnamed protein product [Dovyalis caffra]